MTTKRLTDRAVRAAKPGKHHDGGGHGLMLVVGGSGTRSWVQRVKIRGRKHPRELGLGSYPLVSLAAAREKARENTAMAREGRDPKAERERERASELTLEQAARTVHALGVSGWSAGHAHDWITALELHVFPGLGARPVGEIDAAAVAAVLAKVWVEKPVTARRVAMALSQTFRWAIARGLRQDDPMHAARELLPRAKMRPVPMRAAPYDKVPGVLERVRACSARSATKLGFEFMVLTAARPGEVLGATWWEIDFEQRLWSIPGERMKSARGHWVPLSGRAMEILGEARGLPRARCSDPDAVVFPAADGGPICSTAWVQLLRRVRVDAVAHGFRSSFRTWAAERTNTPREICEMALAHAVPGVEGRYQRGPLVEKRAALMERWAHHLSGAGAEVISIAAFEPRAGQ